MMDQPIEYWIAELAKPSVAERLRAIIALEAIGPAAAPALPALRRQAHRFNPLLRARALDAIAAIEDESCHHERSEGSRRSMR
jgi:hypothetical protein